MHEWVKITLTEQINTFCVTYRKADEPPAPRSLSGCSRNGSEYRAIPGTKLSTARPKSRLGIRHTHPLGLG